MMIMVAVAVVVVVLNLSPKHFVVNWQVLPFYREQTATQIISCLWRR